MNINPKSRKQLQNKQISPKPQPKAEKLKKSAATVGRTQALRTELTRKALIAAAERVFVRDGFEAARVEDIAAEASRSRGAFYANFDSKAELFLALRDQLMQDHLNEIRDCIQHLPSEDERRRKVHTIVAARLFHPKDFLLQIEFKLFALRRPKMLAELAKKHVDLSASRHMEKLSPFFPASSKPMEEARYYMLAVEALLEGFALNSYFSPKVLNRSCLEILIPELLESLFQLNRTKD